MSNVSPGSEEEIANSVLETLLGHPDPLIRYESLTQAQAAYEALVKRIAAERARAVAEMHASGLSYGRIAETIGFTRARAQQLVERAEPLEDKRRHGGAKTMINQREITAFVEAYTAHWPRQQAFPQYQLGQPQPQPMAHQYDAAAIAADLFAQAEFRALQLGTWLNTPDGQLLADAVEAAAPPLYRQDIELLVEALKLAAQMQQKDARTRAAVAAGVIVVGGALLAAAAKS